ncbi:MAG: hypothetical protein JXK07_08095 [Spirochaetes bacterium]|nr:hypothetical protein [Spirochaetota bacterium]MBN2770001.1 hypothetical protein [Spirochaetota bacterium]
MSKYGDLSVILAILFSLISLVLCIVYGALNWNKGGNISPEEAQKEQSWDKEEAHISAELGQGGCEK